MDKLLIKQLNTWFGSELGQHILLSERQKIDDIISNFFGYVAIQIGMPDINYLEKNRMRQKIILPSFESNHNALSSIKTSGNETLSLDFANNSTDLVVLPHTLEVSKHPKKIIEEIYRILVPNGQLIIIGFNPNHIWNLRKLYRSSFSNPIPYKQQLSHRQVRDWCRYYSFNIIPTAQPTRHSSNRKKINYWQFVKMNPWMAKDGAFYIIVAQKKTLGMHLVGPALSQPKKTRHGAIVTTKEINT